MEDNKLQEALLQNNEEIQNKLGAGESILEAASKELSEQDVKNLEALRDAKVNTAVTGNSISGTITPEQLAKLRPRKISQQVRKFKKIGRNDPCPCGAVDENGKPVKYKNCCLKTGKYEGLKSFRKGEPENPYENKEAA